MSDNIAAQLTNYVLFQRLEQADLERLSAIIEVRNMDPGVVIFEQDAPSDGAYLIAEGVVELSRRNRQDASFVLARLQAPESFGDLDLLDAGPRLVTAKTDAPTRLFFLSAAAFNTLMAAKDALSSSLLHRFSMLASQRMRTLDRQIVEALHDPSALGSDPIEARAEVEPDRRLINQLMARLLTSQQHPAVTLPRSDS